MRRLSISFNSNLYSPSHLFGVLRCIAVPWKSLFHSRFYWKLLCFCTYTFKVFLFCFHSLVSAIDVFIHLMESNVSQTGKRDRRHRVTIAKQQIWTNNGHQPIGGWNGIYELFLDALRISLCRAVGARVWV